jgi:hypothetical protein
MKFSIKSANPTRPPIITYDEVEKCWRVRVDYPASSDLAGTYLILSADGSASQLTVDREGNLTEEFKLNKEGE